MTHITDQLTIPNLDPSELLRNGIAAAKVGNREQARLLLLEAVKIDPYNELPFLWLAWAADNPKDALYYVKRVLEINPANKQAKEWLRACLKSSTGRVCLCLWKINDTQATLPMTSGIISKE